MSNIGLLSSAKTLGKIDKSSRQDKISPRIANPDLTRTACAVEKAAGAALTVLTTSAD